jgi:hypothetical protein
MRSNAARKSNSFRGNFICFGKFQEKIEFQYAYLDEDERLVFKSNWPEEPYMGIPRAIKMNIKLKNKEAIFSRLVSLPQGLYRQVNSENFLFLYATANYQTISGHTCAEEKKN